MLISKNKKNNEIVDVSILETKIGYQIPAELTIFLKKYNGGATPRTSFHLEGVSSDIVAFYGIGDVKYSYNEVNVLRVESDIYLPIAFDSFGNTILIDIKNGRVVFLNHEAENDLSVLAPTLKGFISGCKSSQISPSSLKTVEEREEALIKRGRGNVITDELRKMWQEERDKYSNMKQEEVVF